MEAAHQPEAHGQEIWVYQPRLPPQARRKRWSFAFKEKRVESSASGCSIREDRCKSRFAAAIRSRHLNFDKRSPLLRAVWTGLAGGPQPQACQHPKVPPRTTRARTAIRLAGKGGPNSTGTTARQRRDIRPLNFGTRYWRAKTHKSFYENSYFF